MIFIFMRNLIRRILREENEKTPKSKLINLLEKPNGLVKLLNGGFTIEDISDVMEMSKNEIYQRFNPFEFIDKDFKESIEDTIREKIGHDKWIQSRKDFTEEEIFNYLILVGIDGVHYDLIDWNTKDWKIPETEKTLELIYGDWLKQHKGYKTLISLIKSK
jgi:hypothetical protein